MNLINLKNKNVFCAETLLGHQDAQNVHLMKCPHCSVMGSFENINPPRVYRYRKQTKSGAVEDFGCSIRICPSPSCRGLVFAIFSNSGFEQIVPPVLLEISLDNLPERCAATLMEAVACQAAGAYRASAMMVRRLLEEICEDNQASGKTLHDRLKALKNKVVLPEALYDALDELKILGNDAAHVEARNYDSIDKEDSETAIELAKRILEALYQLQGLVSKLQAKKKAPPNP